MAFLAKINNYLIRRPSVFVYNYLKQLSFDYRDAFIDSGRKILKHPIKTIFYSTNIYLLVYAYRTMPSFNSYENDFISFQQEQLFTSNLIRNKQVETYIDTIEQLFLRQQIHFVDCYLFSLIIYKRQHSTNEYSNRVYHNLCSYLHLKRDSKIIDIGAFNRWFILNRQLRKADVSDEINDKKKKIDLK